MCIRDSSRVPSLNLIQWPFTLTSSSLILNWTSQFSSIILPLSFFIDQPHLVRVSAVSLVCISIFTFTTSEPYTITSYTHEWMMTVGQLTWVYEFYQPQNPLPESGWSRMSSTLCQQWVDLDDIMAIIPFLNQVSLQPFTPGCCWVCCYTIIIIINYDH